MANPTPLALLQQPLVVGNYYGPNFYGGLQSVTIPITGPTCRLSPMLLDKGYNFDQAAVAVNIAGSGTITGRIGVYQLDRVTWLPSKLIEELGTVSLSGSNGLVKLNLSPVRNYHDLIGLALQVEGGTGSPQLWADAALFSFSWFGYSAASTTSTTSLAGFLLTSADGVVAGSLPAVNLFNYTKLVSTGSAVLLRRAT